jgi:hypothetical protein
MAKLIQICASQNDLFGLDGNGSVYHYNFKTNKWKRLSRVRRDDGGRSSAEGEPSIERPRLVATRDPVDAAPTARRAR